jgi:hypothetical protein
MGAAHTPTPKGLVCPDCGSDEISLHSFEECCEILKQQRNAMKAERDAAESLVSAQHDALVAMKAERDSWEHRAEVAERENGDALAMLAFTGEPSSLWQAAAAARAKLDEAEQKARYESDVAAQAMAAKDAAERERGDADDALAACQAQAAGTIARLREALDKWEDSALNLLAVVHRDGGQHTATVGFSASCTTAEAVVVALRAKLDAAVRELAQEKEGSAEWEEESAAWNRTCLDVQEECDELRAKLADAERERDDAKINETLSNEQRAVLFCENAKLLAELDAAEKLTYWFLKKYPATWARAKRTLFADTARTAATACERSSPIASGDTQGE